MEWVEYGYLGMFIAAILAATLLPLGSEVVFIALLTQNYDLVALTLVAGSGNTVGGMITYYIGRLGKWEWLEKWFGISHKKLTKHFERAQKYGWLYAFLTWLPIIGDPMAAAIGFVRINPITALIWMFIGKTARFAVMAILWHYGV